jgi:hypothetical protein
MQRLLESGCGSSKSKIDYAERKSKNDCVEQKSKLNENELRKNESANAERTSKINYSERKYKLCGCGQRTSCRRIKGQRIISEVLLQVP